MVDWLCDTFEISPNDVLEPGDWFVKAHDVNAWHKQGVSPWYPEMKPFTFLWTPAPAAAGSLLRKFCLAPRKLETMPKGVVWSVLQTASAQRFSRRTTKR
jgi:hypothetical protein